MIRLVALLGAAVALGVFGATLAHHLRALPPETARGATLGGLSSFLAGLVWLGVGLTLFLQRPTARPERAFFGAALGMALSLFLEAGGAATLGGGFALARDAAATLGAMALALLATRLTSPSQRFALWAALLAPLAWFVLPRPLAFTAPAVAALLIALRGRQVGAAFTARQQATWLGAGLVALVAGALTAAALSPVGTERDAGWARDLAALLSLAVPFTAALSLQKIRLLEADRLVATLGVGTLLAAVALVATVAVHDILHPLPAERRALLTGAFALLAMLTAARMRDAVALRLLDALFPERARLRAALAQAELEVFSLPYAVFAARTAERLGQAVQAEVVLWHVDATGRLRGTDAAGTTALAALRPHGRLWALAAVFGAPLSPDDLADVPLEPNESRWLREDRPTAALLPLVFADRPVGFVQFGPPASGGAGFTDEAWRGLAEFATALAGPFDACAARARADLEAHTAARLAAHRERLRHGRDARMLQRGLQGVTAHLRRRAAAFGPDAADAGAQADVCEVLLSECAAWESVFDRRLQPLGPILDAVLVARAEVLRGARIQVDLEPEVAGTLVFTDADALAVVLLEAFDGVLGVLAHCAGPRLVRISAEPLPDAPGFLDLRLCDSGPPRTPRPPGSGRDDALTAPVLRSLGARARAVALPDAQATAFELPMTVY
jgi:hypothetical protein